MLKVYLENKTYIKMVVNTKIKIMIVFDIDLMLLK